MKGNNAGTLQAKGRPPTLTPKRRRSRDHACECSGRPCPAFALARGSSQDQARTVAICEARFGGGSNVDPYVGDANADRHDVGGTIRRTGASLIRELENGGIGADADARGGPCGLKG